MKTVVLIACAKNKITEATQAKHLYNSPLFRLNYAFAEMLKPNAIHILSAKHGLLNPDTWTEPYDQTLNKMSNDELKFWARNVLQQIFSLYDIHDTRFIFLAGEKYRKHLECLLPFCVVPLKGKGIGEQLQWLKEAVK